EVIEPIQQRMGECLWLGPSCSLLHVPVDLASEHKLDRELLPWLAFAQQKLEEVEVLGIALKQGRDAVRDALAASDAARTSRKSSARVNNPRVQAAVTALDSKMGQ